MDKLFCYVCDEVLLVPYFLHISTLNIAEEYHEKKICGKCHRKFLAIIDKFQDKSNFSFIEESL